MPTLNGRGRASQAVADGCYSRLAIPPAGVLPAPSGIHHNTLPWKKHPNQQQLCTPGTTVLNVMLAAAPHAVRSFAHCKVHTLAGPHSKDPGSNTLNHPNPYAHDPYPVMWTPAGTWSGPIRYTAKHADHPTQPAHSLLQQHTQRQASNNSCTAAAIRECPATAPLRAAATTPATATHQHLHQHQQQLLFTACKTGAWSCPRSASRPLPLTSKPQLGCRRCRKTHHPHYRADCAHSPLLRCTGLQCRRRC